MLGAVEPKFWRAFCEASGHPDWTARQAEPIPQTALMAEVERFFGTLAFAECMERFDAVDCCFSPVLDLEEALTSQQTRSRGLVASGATPGDLQALFPAYVDGERPHPRPALRPAEPDIRHEAAE